MVVRGNLVGHAWRTYQHSKTICGVTMPEGLIENDFFPEPIITPSTKASEGHDEDISEEEILKKGLATPEEWESLKNYTLSLFERGQSIASERGLILADTKYEFGKFNGQIMLMDEVHTPDSSRYFIKEGFQERQKSGHRQLQLSKEFVREWLMANNFMGKEGQTVPEMSNDWIQTISGRYIDLYERIIGQKFQPETMTREEVVTAITNSLYRLQP
jgi:phosphoribosylaminoimidazole-succinocarboxamide synthase